MFSLNECIKIWPCQVIKDIYLHCFFLTYITYLSLQDAKKFIEKLVSENYFYTHGTGKLLLKYGNSVNVLKTYMFWK